MENHNLTELFLLLAQHPKKGRFVIGELQINYGIVGAAFLQMSINDNIEVQDKLLIAKSEPEDKDSFNSYIYNEIVSSKKTRKLKYWLRKFANKVRKYKWEFLESMSDKDYIRIEHHKFLWLIPYRTCYLVNNELQENLISKVKNDILTHENLSEEEMSVIGLVEACKMHRVFSKDRKELKVLRKNTKELTDKNSISGVVNATIKETQAAIVAVMVSSSVVVSTSS